MDEDVLFVKIGHRLKTVVQILLGIFQTMIWALCIALILGQASAQNITIPTDNCEWREQTWGEWNECYGNEIAIGKISRGIVISMNES